MVLRRWLEIRYRSTKFETNSNDQNILSAEAFPTAISLICSGHSNIKISDLSFDFAQDGEQVEPFGISIFGFRICSLFQNA
jgi:hypothetical protein